MGPTQEPESPLREEIVEGMLLAELKSSEPGPLWKAAPVQQHEGENTVEPVPEEPARQAVGSQPFQESETPGIKALFLKQTRRMIGKWYGDIPEEIEELVWALQHQVTILMVLNLLALGCSCYANEMLWWRRFTLDTTQADDEMMINLLKIGSWGASVLSMGFICRYRYLEAEILRLKSTEGSVLHWLGETSLLQWSALGDLP